jgi:hypothetical protein
MTHNESDKERRRDIAFYTVLLLGVAIWLGYCVYDGQIRKAAAKECEARGGRYLNTGFETYGCYKLVPL